MATTGLRRDAIGLREVLFQSITDMAPGAAIAASIPTGAAFAGGALPLSVLIALAGCLLSAWCVGILAREMPSAGSLATYAARGLHPSVGFLMAWAYTLVGILLPPLVLLQLGFTAASTLHSEISGYPADLWWPWAILGALIVLAAGWFGIGVSARLGTILGISEIAVFALLAVLFIVHAGHHNTLGVFGTHYTPAGHRGVSGVIAGSVYTVLAFGGFESAAPLAEEARDPRRTIPRAVLGATLFIGILYVFTTYAASVAYGPGRFVGFGSSGAASWEGMARAFYGIFWFFVFLAIVNSTIANANAGVNVSSRTIYAMGRIRVFPQVLAALHPRHRSPVAGILLAFVTTLAVTLGLGLHYGPITGFGVAATALVIALIAIYIVVNISAIGYFARRRRGFHPVSHLIVPVLGVAVFVPAWLTAAGLPAFSFVTKLTGPLTYAGPAVGVWMVLGVIYLVYLYVRAPERVAEVGLVHLDLED